MLSVSEEVLSLIISDEDFSKPKASIKPTPSLKKIKKSSTNDIANPIEIESYEPITQEETEKVTEELKNRIARLYQGNVKIKIIMALYDIRNPVYIHSFGSWERSHNNRLRFSQLREKIIQLKSEGKNNEEICKILGIKDNKISETLGEIKRPKLIYTTKDIKEAVIAYRTIRNKKKTAKELGVSYFTLAEWIQKESSGELQTIYDNDEGIDPFTILNALETYYLTKNIEKAADVSGLSILKVSKFVEKCRLKALELKDRISKYKENNE